MGGGSEVGRKPQLRLSYIRAIFALSGRDNPYVVVN